MSYSGAGAEPSLTRALERRARSASGRRLTIDIVGGLLIAVALLAWRPGGWLVGLSAALTLAAFGIWGAADRGLTEARRLTGGPVTITLFAIRLLAATLGALAAFTLLYSIAGVVMGTWIS